MSTSVRRLIAWIGTTMVFAAPLIATGGRVLSELGQRWK
jgi:hypothetical protein